MGVAYKWVGVETEIFRGCLQMGGGQLIMRGYFQTGGAMPVKGPCLPTLRAPEEARNQSGNRRKLRVGRGLAKLVCDFIHFLRGGRRRYLFQYYYYLLSRTGTRPGTLPRSWGIRPPPLQVGFVFLRKILSETDLPT